MSTVVKQRAVGRFSIELSESDRRSRLIPKACASAGVRYMRNSRDRHAWLIHQRDVENVEAALIAAGAQIEVTL